MQALETGDGDGLAGRTRQLELPGGRGSRAGELPVDAVDEPGDGARGPRGARRQRVVERAGVQAEARHRLRAAAVLGDEHDRQAEGAVHLQSHQRRYSSTVSSLILSGQGSVKTAHRSG